MLAAMMSSMQSPWHERCNVGINNNNNNIYLKSNIHSIIRYKFSGLYNGIKHPLRKSHMLPTCEPRVFHMGTHVFHIKAQIFHLFSQNVINCPM